MVRRWMMPLAGAALAAGMAAAASTGTAMAAGAPAAHPAIGGVVRLVHGRPDAANSPWSGYVATGSTYTSVTASWVEPALTCKGSNTHAAAWAGLDGYGTQTVEQTGSDFFCNGTTAGYGAWYEMFPAAPVYYSETVKAGDKFTAKVTFSGGKYTLVLADTTEGWTKTTVKSSSGDKRASAEAIIEADPGDVPDFGTLSFSGVDVDGAAIGSTHHTKLVLTGSAGKAEDSVSALTGGDAFSATWLRK